MYENRSRLSNAIPTICKNIIIINVIVWLAQIIFLKRGILLSKYLGLHYFQSQDFGIYQIFTYMFLHDTGSFSHLLFNMFAIFMFGGTIERSWGAKRFLSYYLICGVGAAITHLLIVFLRIYAISGEIFPTHIPEGLTPDKVANLIGLFNSVTIGASGGVFGILLAFGLMYPNAPLYIIPFPFPIKAIWMISFYTVAELFLGVANFSGDNVAHFAHLGGMIFGFLTILYWKRQVKQKSKLKNEDYFR